MTSAKTDVGILTQEWVKKFHFENKVDLNLQVPSENESIKIEVSDIPVDHYPDLEFSNATITNSNDSYLQSILSSSSLPVAATSTPCTGSQTCACYKCQRQRRRAGLNKAIPTAKTNPPNVYTPLNKIKSDPSSREAEELSPISFSSSSKRGPIKKMAAATTNVTTITPPITPSTSPHQQQERQQQQQQKPKRSNTLRKTPTLKSYEKHMPRPAYSQQESIYRIEQTEMQYQTQQKEVLTLRSSSLADQQQQQDNYQISWTEEGTGDNLLTSLVTFQTIFEEKGTDNEGLSDLLEQRAKELKCQKLREQQEVMSPKTAVNIPPRRSDCLTLSHRNGPRHNPLTLYHTMKMKGSSERLHAYSLAFQHCVNANSGMKAWIKRARVPPTRENSKLIQPARKPTIKRSLLHPLSSKKNRVAGEELLWSASTENLGVGTASIKSNASKKSVENISSPAQLIKQDNNQITDVISAAHALLPNQQFSANTTTPLQHQNRVPYEHIDTPGRPRQSTPTSQSTNDFRDTSSVSSSESVNGNGPSSSPIRLKKSRPSRLFSSLGRKTSMRSYNSSNNKASSIRSLEKIDSSDENQEKVLEDLCQILPHIERSRLLPYVQEANNDYMAALQLCKTAVISGKLS